MSSVDIFLNSLLHTKIGRPEKFQHFTFITAVTRDALCCVAELRAHCFEPISSKI